MSSDQPLTFASIAAIPEVLGSIAYFAGTSSFLGPPTDLIALLSTCRNVYNALSFATNKQLWGQLFSFKFDHTAVVRRLSPGWRTAGCLAAESCKRFTAMKRIRHNVITEEDHLSDLWTAYLMLLESDGRNERQLIEWSYLPRFLYHVIGYRLRTPVGVGPGSLWLFDSEGTALTVWLLWMTASPESIRAEPPTLAAEIRTLLLPFIVAGYRFPSFQAPDSHFDLPLCPHQQDPAPHTSGPPSKITKIIHYKHELIIAAPSLTAAALLARTVRSEAIQDVTLLPAPSSHLPATREIANALGRTGKTVEDMSDFQYKVRTRFLERCKIGDADEDEDRPGSKRHDADWYRLVCSYDPWCDQVTLRGVVFTPGTFSGSWDGRIMIPHLQHYLSMLLNHQIPLSTVGVSQERIFLEFQEHHCLEPDERFIEGTNDTRGDDILNAWFPQNTTIRHLDDAIEVHNPATGQTVRYRTYLPDKPPSYSKEVCDTLQKSRPSEDDDESDFEDESTGGGALLAEQVTSIDDDRIWGDTVEHVSSGISDIIVTGKTTEKQGAAWGHFTILGRIRSWDGLCVFVRTPTNADESPYGRWIFKGYVHDERLVGRWRETSTNVENVGWEGGFVMCKIRE